ncbi:hypothetical protein ACXZ1K_14675 [Pedobacter sp. PWIIR3]
MKNILIPTDFKPASLTCIPAVCEQLKNEELSFYFVHVFKLSDSISDLLMLARRSREFEIVSDEFYNGCTEIKRTFPNVKIKIDFLYGSTLSMFRNFLEEYEINSVLEQPNYAPGKINKSSLDTALLIERSGLPVIRVQKSVSKVLEGSENKKINEQELVAV